MFSAKNIVLLTEINGFFDASLLHNYMDVIKSFGINKLLPLVGAFWFILQGSGLL